MGARYDTEHMEEPRSWRPVRILWVHKGAQHAQTYVGELSKCQRSKRRTRYTVRKGENQDWERQTSFTNNIVREKKPKQCGSHYPLLHEGGQPIKA